MTNENCTLDLMEFKYLWQKDGWVKEITDRKEIESLVNDKKESTSQFGYEWYNSEYDFTKYELEIKMTLKDGSFLYALNSFIEPKDRQNEVQSANGNYCRPTHGINKQTQKLKCETE